MHFWLLVLDRMPFGSRAYDWVLKRASDCVDWSEP